MDSDDVTLNATLVTEVLGIQPATQGLGCLVVLNTTRGAVALEMSSSMLCTVTRALLQAAAAMGTQAGEAPRRPFDPSSSVLLPAEHVEVERPLATQRRLAIQVGTMHFSLMLSHPDQTRRLAQDLAAP